MIPLERFDFDAVTDSYSKPHDVDGSIKSQQQVSLNAAVFLR